MGPQNQRSSSLNDKSGREADQVDNSPSPSSSYFNIRTIKMTSPIEEQFNLIVERTQEAEAAYSVRFIGVEVERGNGPPLRESFPEQPEGPFPQEANNNDNRPLLMNTDRGQVLLREVLMAEHNQRTESPTSTEPEVVQNETEPATSPTPTELNHPRYPYREHTDANTDLAPSTFERPYLTAGVNKANGDPRLFGTVGTNEPVYDEGPLTSQPITDDPDGDDEDNEVTTYNFGEDAYLDPSFLQAMGSLADRGLATEGLRLVQLDGEFRHLDRWDKRLAARERATLVERGQLIKKTNDARDQQKAIQN